MINNNKKEKSIVMLSNEEKKFLEREAELEQVNLIIQKDMSKDIMGQYDPKTNSVIIPEQLNLSALNSRFRQYQWFKEEIKLAYYFRIIFYHEIAHKKYPEIVPMGSGTLPEEKQDKFAYDKVMRFRSCLSI